ncbi:Cys-tRNA(Pro) deacylase [bacterium BMS3Abin03]|nr:Cys-tRNA(Pro) deacylase [bacterium BMS3Abin03]MCG6961136.1 Cys-tRNA(Pro) deacylase [bacterium BMS3Abin03]
MRSHKTNAVRILEANNIPHTTITYEINETDLSGITVANKIGTEPERVFKTLVTRGDKNGINVFCIPVTEELDLKKAAIASGNKKVEMIKEKELLPLTGYTKGGCSPIGMKKKYPTYIDETVQLFEEITVSAGIRGMQVKLKPEDLLKIVDGVFAELIF